MPGNEDWLNGEAQPESRAKRIGMTALRILLVAGFLFYVLFHLTGGFAEDLRVQMAQVETEAYTLPLRGTVVQSETPVRAPGGYVIDYALADGERVRAGSKLATLYGTGTDRETVARIAELDAVIDRLHAVEINRETTVADGVAASAKAHSLLSGIAEQVARGDFAGIKSEIGDFSYTVSRRDMILSGEGSVTARLAELESERARLAASLPGGSRTLPASESGYFFHTSDGLEGAFDYAHLAEWTPETYRAALEKPAADTSDRIGRLVRFPRWYFAATVDTAQAEELHLGALYPLEFVADGVWLDMELCARNKSEDGTEILLVFTTQEMPAGFDFSRAQQVNVETGSISGYRIPASALRMADGQTGVYVRMGNRILFRVCDVIGESGIYVYVSADADAEGKTLYAGDDDPDNDVFCMPLALYDQVIVSGARALYPNEIIN